ncbi:MAG: hypothetical protein ABH864_01840 [archaeon]
MSRIDDPLTLGVCIKAGRAEGREFVNPLTGRPYRVITLGKKDELGNHPGSRIQYDCAGQPVEATVFRGQLKDREVPYGDESERI